MFSESGTFVLVSLDTYLRPSAPHLIHQLHADPVNTRYLPLEYYYNHHKNLTPSGEFAIEPEEVDSTSYRLVSCKVPKNDISEESTDLTHKNQDETPVYLDNVISYPASLADSDRFLLLGQNDDEMMRLLIAPHEGRALEIRSLSLSFNEAKRRMEAEWRKREALRDSQED